MAISGFPVINQAAQVAASVGDLSQLPTANKTDIVSAIIELDNSVDSIPLFSSEVIELTATHISNKSFLLDFEPKPSTLQLFVIQGILQKENVDFLVVGQTVSWSGLALELLLTVGTFVHVNYIRD